MGHPHAYLDFLSRYRGHGCPFSGPQTLDASTCSQAQMGNTNRTQRRVFRPVVEMNQSPTISLQGS